jgi:hypothetical protein
MSEYRTYRVRHGEWQTLAINLSARSPEEACELARQIRSEIGQQLFEEMDGAIEKFEAKELDAREFGKAVRHDPAHSQGRAPVLRDLPRPLQAAPHRDHPLSHGRHRLAPREDAPGRNPLPAPCLRDRRARRVAFERAQKAKRKGGRS